MTERKHIIVAVRVKSKTNFFEFKTKKQRDSFVKAIKKLNVNYITTV